VSVVMLSLDRERTEGLYRLAVMARARAFEAQADAERAQAAWYLALGDRVTAGEATDRAEDLEREALLRPRLVVPPAHPRVAERRRRVA